MMLRCKVPVCFIVVTLFAFMYYGVALRFNLIENSFHHVRDGFVYFVILILRNY
jgi:hypothetical protein